MVGPTKKTTTPSPSSRTFFKVYGPETEKIKNKLSRKFFPTSRPFLLLQHRKQPFQSPSRLLLQFLLLPFHLGFQLESLLEPIVFHRQCHLEYFKHPPHLSRPIFKMSSSRRRLDKKPDRYVPKNDPEMSIAWTVVAVRRRSLKRLLITSPRKKHAR